MIFMCTFLCDNMKDDIYYMTQALKEAYKAYDNDEVPIGAVIVRNGEIIARGYNRKVKTNNVIKHAEIFSIEKACRKLDNWRLNDCTIYITMFPCPMCASAINQSRIKKIVYGTIPNSFDKSIVDKILVDKNYGLPVEIEGGILENECATLIKKFFFEKR